MLIEVIREQFTSNLFWSVYNTMIGNLNYKKELLFAYKHSRIHNHWPVILNSVHLLSLPLISVHFLNVFYKCENGTDFLV